MKQPAVAPFLSERKPFYTVVEVAKMLDVHPSTIREWIRDEKLFAFRFSERVVRIPLGSLMQMFGESQPVTHEEALPGESEKFWRQVSAEHETISSL